MAVPQDEGKGAVRGVNRRPWRSATSWLLAATALAGQVALVWRVPTQFQQPVCWMMSMLWLACAQLVARLTGPRATRPTAPTSHSMPDAPVAVTADGDRQPSERMRAAWSAARAGGDAELVAQVAGVPHALAELILADARSDPSGHEA